MAFAAGLRPCCGRVACDSRIEAYVMDENLAYYRQKSDQWAREREREERIEEGRQEAELWREKSDDPKAPLSEWPGWARGYLA